MKGKGEGEERRRVLKTEIEMKNYYTLLSGVFLYNVFLGIELPAMSIEAPCRF